MNIEQLWKAQQGQESRERAYEESCALVPVGHLSAPEVCRLFADEPAEEWRRSPGKRARELVQALDLPLMELGSGRWVVTFNLEGLES